MKCVTILAEYDIDFKPQTTVKSQVLANLLTDLQAMASFLNGADQDRTTSWNLYANGSSSEQGAGAGIVLETPNDIIIEKAIRYRFPPSNKEAEYEALI